MVMVIITDHTLFKPSSISNIRVGAPIEAGLPNATGTCGVVQNNRNGTTGIITSSYTNNYGMINAQNVSGYVIQSVDLSKGNALYGSSETVTPLSIGVAFYIKF